MAQTVLLIADDQEDNRIVFSAILTHHGYGVILAVDGQEALDLARDHAPQLILMDLQMPILDGCEAARLLKADPATAGIPIIAVSALDRPAPDKLTEAGFCAYVQKPVLPRDVVGVVALCLEPEHKGKPWIDLARFHVAPPVLEI